MNATLKENEFYIKHIAGYFGLSYSRTRGIIKALSLRPKRYVGNMPVFTSAQVLKIEKRNTKPGPKGKKR